MEQSDYPSPDMAIEIDMSGPKVDRPAIYADLSVAEVWRLGRKRFVIEQLQADGSYAPAEESRFLGSAPTSSSAGYPRMTDSTNQPGAFA